MMMDNKTVNELTSVLYGMTHKYNFDDDEGIALVAATKALEAFPQWIPITARPMTDEEREYYEIADEDDDLAWMYDCPLPDDADEVLITGRWGVDMTTFYNDDEYGAYFESYEDRGDVLAWMPLPKRYKAESEDKE